MRKLLGITLIISVFGFTLLGAFIRGETSDFLDRYEVVSSEKDPTSDQYAVTFTHYHSNSSNIVLTASIENASRAVGSTQQVSSKSAIIWRGLKHERPRWVEGRLMFVVPFGTEFRDINSSECYFAYDVNPIVCFDSKLASVQIN
jgi:hypothetical protein